MTDRGGVNFNVDFSTGMVRVSVRPPLAINSADVDLPILDFLDIAANLQLAVNKQSREAAAQIQRQGLRAIAGDGRPT